MTLIITFFAQGGSCIGPVTRSEIQAKFGWSRCAADRNQFEKCSFPASCLVAAGINIPVLFIMQLEDELFTRQDCLALFDALASSDKRLHANAGLHPDVPVEELHHSVDFLVAGLMGERQARTPAFSVPG